MYKRQSSITQEDSKSEPHLIKQYQLPMPHYLPVLNEPQKSIKEVISSHSSLYTSIIYFYLTEILPDQHRIDRLRGIIESVQMNELMVVQKQTLPKYYQQIYEFKGLKSSLMSCLQRVQNHINKQLEIRSLGSQILTEPLSLLSFILLFRSMTFKRYSISKQQAWVLGNEGEILKDFREDARGNVLKLLCSELQISIQVYVCNGITQTAKSNHYNPTSTKVLTLVLEQKRVFIVESKSGPSESNSLQKAVHKGQEVRKQQRPKPKIEEQRNRQTEAQDRDPRIHLQRTLTSKSQITSSTQHQIRQQSEISTVSSSEIKSKTCVKCGRIKTEKFCICRKGREESAPKTASKFQPGIITSNCRKCFVNRPVLGESYCRECKVRLGK